MNSIIPMHNIDTDYNELVQHDRVHTSLYKDEKSLKMKWKNFL